MDDEAVEIMKSLVERGASRVTLVRAAAAATRAVIPFAGQRQAEVIAAMATVQHWIRDPSKANTLMVINQVFSIGHRYKASAETYAISAAKNTVLACFQLTDTLSPAVFAVEYAVKAAAGHDVYLKCIIMAEVL